MRSLAAIFTNSLKQLSLSFLIFIHFLTLQQQKISKNIFIISNILIKYFDTCMLIITIIIRYWYQGYRDQLASRYIEKSPISTVPIGSWRALNCVITSSLLLIVVMTILSQPSLGGQPLVLDEFTLTLGLERCILLDGISHHCGSTILHIQCRQHEFLLVYLTGSKTN